MKQLVFVCLSFILQFSCSTSKQLAVAPPHRDSDLFTIRTARSSDCNCSTIYIESFRHGQKLSELAYSAKEARKSVYLYDETNTLVDTLKFIALEANYQQPFDSLDVEMFSLVETVIATDTSLSPIQMRDYKGYSKVRSSKR